MDKQEYTPVLNEDEEVSEEGIVNKRKPREKVPYSEAFH